ncbi:MAG: restriction endonuclease subunit S [Nodularia sp. (in: Bacteria)]|nr:MAG: restriction endonuclease subunit S [Nodularia sp. (in: cyanobacteria)]
MKRYLKYKDSGVQWLGYIPEHWEVIPAFVVFKEQCFRNKNLVEKNLLSLSYGKIVRKDFGVNFGLLPESFETYQIVIPGNIILRLTDLQNDKKSLRVGLVKEKGIITSAYLCLQPQNIFEKYVYTFLHNYDVLKVFYNMGSGVRQNMTFKDLKWLPILVPPLSEQKKIACFLDSKLEEIDKFISNKQRLIELLKEQKTAIINRAVTKGLNPHAPMKPSGIEWLGDIPAHWEVKRNKYIFREINERSETGQETYLAMSQRLGLVTRSQLGEQHLSTSENQIGYKLCQVNDLVLNKLKAYLGVFCKASIPGLVSPDYAVFRAILNIEVDYFEYLFKTPDYIAEFNRFSTGIVIGFFRLYTPDFYNIYSLFPPFDEQNKIVQYIKNESFIVNQAIATIEKEIELIKEYRTTLISEAVTGKIDVRET